MKNTLLHVKALQSKLQCKHKLAVREIREGNKEGKEQWWKILRVKLPRLVNVVHSNFGQKEVCSRMYSSMQSKSPL